MAEEKSGYKPVYLDDEQIMEKGLQIIELLKPLPLGHACCVLERTRQLMLQCHMVDPDNEQFKWCVADYRKFYASGSGSPCTPRK